MVACAKWLGRDHQTCTRRWPGGCTCKEKSMSFSMFYGERIGDPDKGEPYIAERGVFYSIEEFAPYRAKGWEGTKETNAAADSYLDNQRSKGNG